LLRAGKIKTKQKDLATSCGATGIVNQRPILIIVSSLYLMPHKNLKLDVNLNNGHLRKNQKLLL
jgi:hypothetical protein